MEDYIKERVLKEAREYVTSPMATVRSLELTNGVAKSTIHEDLVKRLPQVEGNYELKLKVREKIKKNTQESSLRGGEATRRKYLK